MEKAINTQDISHGMFRLNRSVLNLANNLLKGNDIGKIIVELANCDEEIYRLVDGLDILAAHSLCESNIILAEIINNY